MNQRHHRQPVLRMMVALLYILLTCSIVTAFTALKPSSLRTSTILRAGGSNDPLGDASELTSALARLDQQWKIQQSGKGPRSRWSKLVLPQDSNQQVEEQTPGSMELKPEEFVWLLEPPSNTIPSCIIVFTGGAGLGQFPHIAYNQLLRRVSDRLNAAVVSAPYEIGLDHFSLAKQTGERLRRALLYCEDDPSRQYPASIPTYCLGHSLGCKLQTIYMGATGQDYEGIGFMSFNNFSFGKTISMARMFAQELRNNGGMGGMGGAMPNSPFGAAIGNEEMLNTIFSFAENAIGAIGLDFSPNAKDTERLIQMKYDDVLQKKTRLFVFDEDNLDNSKEFVDNCMGGPGPSASGLPGGHLSPVYFKLGFNDLEDVPEDLKDMAKEAAGGFESASFGDEEALNDLVDEVCDWILGKGPSRGPRWDAAARNEPPRLEAFSSAKQ
jgi:hypothetical protein